MQISLGKETSANNKTSSYQYYCHCPPLIVVLLLLFIFIRDRIDILFAVIWKWRWRVFSTFLKWGLKHNIYFVVLCYIDGESGLFINFSHAAISQVWYYNHNTLLQYYNRRVLTQTIHYQEAPILVWYSQSILLTNTQHNKIYLKWSV